MRAIKLLLGSIVMFLFGFLFVFLAVIFEDSTLALWIFVPLAFFLLLASVGFFIVGMMEKTK